MRINQQNLLRGSACLGSAMLTLPACHWFFQHSGATGWLSVIALALFTILFGWVAFSFNLALIGFLDCLLNRPRRESGAHSRDDNHQDLALSDDSLIAATRVAVLVPVYNEDPIDVSARIDAMMTGLEASSDETPVRTPRFDFFVLSDTRNEQIADAELRCFDTLRERHSNDGTCRVFYRRRLENRERKAGNIKDFCERWSASYRFLLILDADSLVEASTLKELVRRINSDPTLGILQVPPRPIGRESLFARLQQFSAAAYSSIFCAGYDRWSGDAGNYWGHNAIIRTHAFRDCCSLPRLPGRAPLGGEILSHDFVEASLMVRNGWKVRLATDLDGSYEECPTTLTDYAIRDQRWCQGNLQHTRLLLSEGFHPLSRFHFANGIMSYVCSPLWLAFVLVLAIATASPPQHPLSDVTQRSTHDAAAPEISIQLADFIVHAGLFSDMIPAEAISSPSVMLILFATTFALLILPKLFAVIALIVRGRADRFGGIPRLVASMTVETAFSIVLAPIMAILHSSFVLMTIGGKRVTWNCQQRCEIDTPWSDLIRDYGRIAVLGLATTVSVAFVRPSILPWLAPMLVGPVFVVPIAATLASRRLGRLTKRLGLLNIPEEISPSPVAVRYQKNLRSAD